MNIKDVAKICGVGVSTVSRVLNNHPDVNSETRKKVLAVIKYTNYVPNNSARILKRNNTMNIGVLLKGLEIIYLQLELIMKRHPMKQLLI